MHAHRAGRLGSMHAGLRRSASATSSKRHACAATWLQRAQPRPWFSPLYCQDVAKARMMVHQPQRAASTTTAAYSNKDSSSREVCSSCGASGHTRQTCPVAAASAAAVVVPQVPSVSAPNTMNSRRGGRSRRRAMFSDDPLPQRVAASSTVQPSTRPTLDMPSLEATLGVLEAYQAATTTAATATATAASGTSTSTSTSASNNSNGTATTQQPREPGEATRAAETAEAAETADSATTPGFKSSKRRAKRLQRRRQKRKTAAPVAATAATGPEAAQQQEKKVAAAATAAPSLFPPMLDLQAPTAATSTPWPRRQPSPPAAGASTAQRWAPTTPSTSSPNSNNKQPKGATSTPTAAASAAAATTGQPCAACGSVEHPDKQCLPCTLCGTAGHSRPDCPSQEAVHTTLIATQQRRRVGLHPWHVWQLTEVDAVLASQGAARTGGTAVEVATGVQPGTTQSGCAAVPLTHHALNLLQEGWQPLLGFAERRLTTAEEGRPAKDEEEAASSSSSSESEGEDQPTRLSAFTLGPITAHLLAPPLSASSDSLDARAALSRVAGLVTRVSQLKQAHLALALRCSFSRPALHPGQEWSVRDQLDAPSTRALMRFLGSSDCGGSKADTGSLLRWQYILRVTASHQSASAQASRTPSVVTRLLKEVIGASEPDYSSSYNWAASVPQHIASLMAASGALWSPDGVAATAPLWWRAEAAACLLRCLSRSHVERWAAFGPVLSSLQAGQHGRIPELEVGDRHVDPLRVMAETLASLRRQRVPIEDAALAATVGLLVESQRPLEAWQLALRVAGRPQRLSRSAGSAATLSSLSSGGGGEGMPTGEGDAEEGMYPWYWCGGGAAGGMLLASSWRERVHPVYQETVRTTIDWLEQQNLVDDLLRGLLLRGRHHQVVDIRAHGLRALSALSAQAVCGKHESMNKFLHNYNRRATGGMIDYTARQHAMYELTAALVQWGDSVEACRVVLSQAERDNVPIHNAIADLLTKSFLAELSEDNASQLLLLLANVQPTFFEYAPQAAAKVDNWLPYHVEMLVLRGKWTEFMTEELWDIVLPELMRSTRSTKAEDQMQLLRTALHTMRETGMEPSQELLASLNEHVSKMRAGFTADLNLLQQNVAAVGQLQLNPYELSGLFQGSLSGSHDSFELLQYSSPVDPDSVWEEEALATQAAIEAGSVTAEEALAQAAEPVCVDVPAGIDLDVVAEALGRVSEVGDAEPSSHLLPQHVTLKNLDSMLGNMAEVLLAKLASGASSDEEGSSV